MKTQNKQASKKKQRPEPEVCVCTVLPSPAAELWVDAPWGTYLHLQRS